MGRMDGWRVLGVRVHVLYTCLTQEVAGVALSVLRIASPRPQLENDV